MKLLAIVHIYYAVGWDYLLARLQNLKKYDCTIIFNLNPNQKNKSEILDYIKTNFHDYILIEAPDHGRDIGGKLSAIDIAIKLNLKSDFTLIIHDKQSIHAPNRLLWRNELFKIIDNNQLPLIFSKFKNDERTGVVGSKKFIMNEFDKAEQKFNSSCNQILQQLIGEFGLKISDYSFIAGNIFWIRSEILRIFFTHHSALGVRSTLERGNALDFQKGTYIHSWERMLSWLAPMYGYKIIGI